MLIVVAAVRAESRRGRMAGGLLLLAHRSSVGSLTLIMIHRLTGGRWGEVIAPAF